MTVRDFLRLEFRPTNFLLAIRKYGGGQCMYSEEFNSEDDKEYKKLDKLGLLDKKVAMISFDSNILVITLALDEV